MPEVRKPSILIPYPGSCSNHDCQDIFVYLRPETNGVRCESSLFKVIRSCPLYQEKVKLIYLANLPGDFIVSNHVIEEHYAVKFHFAVVGKAAFSQAMQEKFTAFFQEDFNQASIVGAFEYMYEKGLEPEELFNTWVAPYDLLIVNGQSIKHIDGRYIVNYDIPALIHKNSNRTDIAVMIFRTRLNAREFKHMIEEITKVFIEEKIMDPYKPPSRFLHYSKGPFEQILDGIGYLYDQRGRHISLENISFCRYLIEQRIDLEEIRGILRNPIMSFRDHEEIKEENLLDYTNGDTYQEALEIYRKAVSQMILR